MPVLPVVSVVPDLTPPTYTNIDGNGKTLSACTGNAGYTVDWTARCPFIPIVPVGVKVVKVGTIVTIGTASHHAPAVKCVPPGAGDT